MCIICALSQLKHKSMSYLILLIIRHEYARLILNCLKLKSALWSHLARQHWKCTTSLCVILINAWGIFTECKCEDAEIHLDFTSPLESIKGGPMSICYLDVTPSLDKRKDRPLTSGVCYCMCVHFHLNRALCREWHRCLPFTLGSLHTFTYSCRRICLIVYRHSKRFSLCSET